MFVSQVILLLARCGAQGPQIGPPLDSLARSLINVTDYYNVGARPTPDQVPTAPAPQGIAAGSFGAGVDQRPRTHDSGPQGKDFDKPDKKTVDAPPTPFDPLAKHICQVKAGGGRRLHMIKATSEEFILTGNTAFVLNVGFDQHGDVAGRSKVTMERWNAQSQGLLMEQFDKMTFFQKGKKEIETGAAATYQLGKAGLAYLGEERYVILTGGTSELKAAVPTGAEYFDYLQKSYESIMKLLHSGDAKVRSAVLHPLAMGGQFQKDWVIDKEVLVFFAGNMISYHMSEEGALDPTWPLTDVYLTAYDDDAVYAMCKYCQYRTLRESNEIGGGYCSELRGVINNAKSDATSMTLLSTVLMAMWAW